MSLEDARTGNTRILVKNDSKGYAQSLAFSPVAQTILFAASGAPQKKPPGIQGYLPDCSPASSACLISILQMYWLEKAQAHGLPWDLWLVHLDAMKFERLTNMGADSPVPVWSPDGKFIIFLRRVESTEWIARPGPSTKFPQTEDMASSLGVERTLQEHVAHPTQIWYRYSPGMSSTRYSLSAANIA